MSLKGKLFATFLSITMAALLLSSWVFYHQFKAQLLHLNKEKIFAINQLQYSRLKEFVEASEEKMALVLGRPQLNHRLQEYILDSSAVRVERLHELAIKVVRAVSGVEGMAIVNQKGESIVSTNPLFSGKATIKNHVNKDIGRPNWKFFLNEFKEGPVLDLASLFIVGEKDSFYVHIQFNRGDLEQIGSNHSALGRTGETLVVQKEDDSVLFVSPTRFSNEAFTQKFSIRTELPAAQAILSTEGAVTETGDYRDQKVLFASRKLPGINWAILTKIDKAEILEPVMIIRDVIIIGTILIVLVVVIITYFFSAYSIRHLLLLNRSVQRFAHNETWEPIKPVGGGGEISNLIKSFNEMAENLDFSERQLKKRIEDLKEKNDELDTFAYMVSHDLKAPLRGVRSLADMIIEDYEGRLDEKGKEMLQLMQERVNKMDKMIQGILQYSRIGRRNVSKQEVELEELVNEVVHDVDVPKTTSLRVHLNKSKVKMNRTALTQVFHNLISNAVKYNDNHHPSLTINELRLPDGRLRVEVIDNGPGIPEKHRQQIFQVFTSVPGNKVKDSTGIGLAIVRKIVESEGGECGVETAPGGGSTFWFILPASKVAK